MIWPFLSSAVAGTFLSLFFEFFNIHLQIIIAVLVRAHTDR